MKWDLTYHFKDVESFNEAFNEVVTMLNEFPKYEGKLHEENSFKEYYLLNIKFSEKAERVYQYAALKSDLNKKNVENEATLNKCRMAFYQLAELTSFEQPEILELGQETVMKFLDQNPEIEEYRFYFEKIFRQKEHILDAKSEKLLSYYNNLTSKGSETYSHLSISDGVNQEVSLSTGEKVTVTQGNWRALISDNKEAADRQLIFEAIFKQYGNNRNTYASIYDTVMKGELADVKARNFNSILESHLYANNIPVAVYHNLIDVAGNNNAAVKKYIGLIKDYLGLEKYHTYDRFLELATSTKKYTYQEAEELFYKSIEKFPAPFVEKAHEVLREGFVDVYETDGKASGAYSSSMTNLHPFILLNYDETLDSVFTLAHEAGHSMHSMYAAESQPGVLQNYTIFVAEIASTFNEHILLDYFINSGNATREEKIMVLQKAIDNIVSTFYRQTLFGEYELRAHQLVEQQQPINHEVLSQIMIDLYKKYYGLDITEEVYKQYVWAYIPHLFYTPFYVYQYATSFAASFKLYKNVKENVEGAMDKYIDLLRSGGSKFPVEQAYEAGVDFTQKDAFLAVVERMTELVDELEKVLKDK